ncbi:MAG: hypothetical protein OZSIB_0529 [Candidatus Ozemobacter sibiricus]|uniref:Uncharacterized protein n=1 Tax=Candidatus Ozemobacter sibiricus TaxID=2268124 RepID=A0A367ZLJ9_9BACT|nr:MAG: hypothetical protein OZSIB_0529 [Candidatus Ozemobacter sibiricus]
MPPRRTQRQRAPLVASLGPAVGPVAGRSRHRLPRGVRPATSWSPPAAHGERRAERAGRRLTGDQGWSRVFFAKQKMPRCWRNHV